MMPRLMAVALAAVRVRGRRASGVPGLAVWSAAAGFAATAAGAVVSLAVSGAAAKTVVWAAMSGAVAVTAGVFYGRGTGRRRRQVDELES